MAKHILALNIPTTLNKCILTVCDESIYAEGLAVDCPSIVITPPGFTCPIEFNCLDTFCCKNFTACDLDLQTDGCQESCFNDLPDGIYVIKYSVSPHDKVFVEYNHLRITKALWMYNNILCDLDLSDCEPGQETKMKLAKIRQIKTYLDAAKATVEICHDPKKGMDLYNYAMKQMKKFTCEDC